MKKIVIGSLILVSAGFPIALEYPYLYKDPRVMGMGGAYVAVGGTSTALFYNPAGLAKIDKKAGFEVDLIGLTLEYSSEGRSFVEDMQNALNTGDNNNDGSSDDDKLIEVNKVLKKYRGKTLHFSLNSFPSIARRFEKFAFAIGGLASAKVQAIPRQGFGPNGLLSVDANVTYGGLGGLSYTHKKLSLGVGLKQLRRESVVKDFSARELVENQDNLDTYLMDEVKKSGNALGFDAGVIYDTIKIAGFQTSVGASYLNIGDLNFGDAGKVPGTLNAGIALKKSRNARFFKNFTFALDVVDLTKNYEQDKDWGKRIRAGAEVKVWSGKMSDFALRVGSYQGSWTAGAELRLLILRVVATTYAEEMGAYPGQDPNRRYMLSAYITW